MKLATRTRMRLWVLLFCVSLLPLSARAQSDSEKLKKFFADSFEEQLKESPEGATAIGRHEYDDRWNDWSKAGRELRRKHAQELLQQLKAFPFDKQSEQDKLSVRLFQYDEEQQLASEDIETHLVRV